MRVEVASFSRSLCHVSIVDVDMDVVKSFDSKPTREFKCILLADFVESSSKDETSQQ